MTLGVTKLIRFLWGDMSKEELKRFSILSLTFFFLIGSYWFVRVLKDPIFSNLIDYRYQPYAKQISLVVVVCLVLIYNKLISVLQKSTLFYSIALFFGAGFLGIGYILSHPAVFQSKLLGWFIYCFIEGFGSIMPALFLSIVVSSMSAESAKKGYGMIYTFGQLGLLLGQIFLLNNYKNFSFGTLFAIGGGLVCLLPFFLFWYFKHAPVTKEEKIEAKEHKPETGMLEGLKLLLSRPYVAGLLVITSAYEIIGTIVEYQMGWCAQIVYPKAIDGGMGFAWLKSMNALGVGILSLAFALLGTSFLLRKFGLKFCIISYPTLIGATVLGIFGLYMTGASTYTLMWASFIGAFLFKALSYTLNNPAREVLYIPTSKDIKFKAKSWIEAFGNRSFKVGGTAVTGTLGATLPPLLIFGTFVSLGVVGFWIFVATYMGNQFNKLQKEGKLVE